MPTHQIIRRTGIRRVLFAFIHSFNGFKWLCRNEAAFQQQLMWIVPLSILALWLDLSANRTLLLLLSMLFVLFAEMLNTAIEVIVDRISHDYHQLSGVAKDIGSALVMLSMIGSAMVWGTILWDY